jgi:hypothetical protein
MPYKATIRVIAPNSTVEPYGSGKALTQADALAEVKAIVATVVGGTIKSVTVSHEYTAAEIATEAIAVSSATNQFEDVDLVLERVDAVLGLVTKTRFVENMDLLYKLAGRPEVDITNADILAIATAYRDGDGIGGYTLSPASKFRV